MAIAISDRTPTAAAIVAPSPTAGASQVSEFDPPMSLTNAVEPSVRAEDPTGSSHLSRQQPTGRSTAPLSVPYCMGREPRHLPMCTQGRSLVELTTRTIQGRYLLCPSGTLNLITIGILARAQKLTGAQVHGASFLSSHGQILA